MLHMQLSVGQLQQGHKQWLDTTLNLEVICEYIANASDDPRLAQMSCYCYGGKHNGYFK